VMNILARREGTELFVPVHPAADPHGHVVVRSVGRVHRFAESQSVI